MGGSPTQPEPRYETATMMKHMEPLHLTEMKKETYFPANIPVSRGTTDEKGNAVALTSAQEALRKADLDATIEEDRKFQAAKDAYNNQENARQLALANASSSQNGLGREATKSAYQAMKVLDK